MAGLNEICITQTAATVLALLGEKKGAEMVEPDRRVLAQAEKLYGAGGCDRVFMYHPDAVAMWIYEKYRAHFAQLEKRAALRLPMRSVVPPVTPVAFASMYSGLQPAQHGIMKYEKPVLGVETVFDRLPEAGKRVAVISTQGDSISLIFLERQVDYFIYPTKQECNEKAMGLIAEDTYDLIVLYNGDYDYYMHRRTPEGKRALQALDENIDTWCGIYDRIRDCWKGHCTALAFAPDHGCHRMLGFLGTHGKEEPCDMNIMHFYSFLQEQAEP